MTINLTQQFLSEVIMFACVAGSIRITRGEMHKLCLLLGQPNREADVEAFAPFVETRSVPATHTADQAFALLN